MPVAVFDMNETTLDLAPVREAVDELLAPSGGFVVWFQKLLQLSMSVTAAGQPFVGFGTLAKHAFDAVDATSPAGLADDAFAPVGRAMRELQTYPEVHAAIDRLNEAGWTTMALTNSAQAMVEAQCDHAGLTDRFDHIVSVEQVGAYKPAPAGYRHAAEVTGAALGDMWMVATHDWDLAGARAVGMNTAFVQRPGMSYAGVYDAADVSVADFTELADALLGQGGN